MIVDRYTQAIAEAMVFHHIINHIEEFTKENFKKIIKSFQSKVQLTPDGDANPDTLWAMQEPMVEQSSKQPIVSLKVDKIKGIWSLDKLELREDAATNFDILYKEWTSLGGVLSTAAGIRAVKSTAGTGQSPTSMHYPGLAFDLNIKAGFFNPEVDAYIITKVPTPDSKDPNRYRWNVWSRSDAGTEMELDAYYWENEKSGVDLIKKVRGKFINFTEIAIKNGFFPIRPQTCFTRKENRTYICCEWWHFQANNILINKFSQLGIELMKIEDYSSDFLKTNNPKIWEARKSTYGKNWW